AGSVRAAPLDPGVAAGIGPQYARILAVGGALDTDEFRAESLHADAAVRIGSKNGGGGGEGCADDAVPAAHAISLHAWASPEVVPQHSGPPVGTACAPDGTDAVRADAEHAGARRAGTLHADETSCAFHADAAWIVIPSSHTDAGRARG